MGKQLSKSALNPKSELVGQVKTLDLDQDKLSLERALGLNWYIQSDTFKFKITIRDRPFTQRGLLSVVCSIYDPLGIFVVLPAKKDISIYASFIYESKIQSGTYLAPLATYHSSYGSHMNCCNSSCKFGQCVGQCLDSVVRAAIRSCTVSPKHWMIRGYHQNTHFRTFVANRVSATVVP